MAKNRNIIDHLGFVVEDARETLEKAGYTWDENGKLHYPNQGKNNNW